MNQGIETSLVLLTHTYTQRCFTFLHTAPNSNQPPSILSHLYSVCVCLYNCGRVTVLVAPSGTWNEVNGVKSTGKFIATL